MAEPSVTILMTVRNGEPYVREAVASILGQTYRDFRFLILDNASTDSSRDTIRSFADPRIDLVELAEDMGQTAALNKGLDMIETPFVARMDADDVSMPRRLEKQVAYMEQNPQVVLVGTWVQVIDGKGTCLRTLHPPTSHQAILGYFATNNPFAHTSTLFRSVSIKELGGYPYDYPTAQDLALWFQLSCCNEVANLPEELVQLRMHPAQTNRSRELAPAKRWDTYRIYRSAQNHQGLSEQTRKLARRNAAHAMLGYAEALSEEGHRADGLRWGATVCLRYPVLCASDLGIGARIMLLVLGRSAYRFARTLKRGFARMRRARPLDSR